DPQVRFRQGPRGLAAQLPGHAEVGDDRVAGVEREPEVLAAPADIEDLAVRQDGREMRLTGQVAADRAGVGVLDGVNGAAGDPAGQALAYRLDLGKFRHQMLNFQTATR